MLFEGSDLITEINEAFSPFKSQVVNMTEVRCALALSRQKRIAAVNSRLTHAHVDGLGEVVASIDTELYHRLASIHGYPTMKDPGFLKSLLRDNPECRVKSVSRKTRVAVGDQEYKSPSTPSIGSIPSMPGINTDATTAASRADVCTSAC